MTKTHRLLRRFRKDSGLTCAELARKLGIAVPTVRSLENGTRPITAERAVEIEIKTGGALKRQDLRPDLFGKANAATGD